MSSIKTLASPTTANIIPPPIYTSFPTAWDYWPRRLLHIPTMTSVERDDENVYSHPPSVQPAVRPKYSILTYTWGRFRRDNDKVGPALPVKNTPWIIPRIKPEFFSVEQFQRVVNFLGQDGVEWAWIDVACIDQEDEVVNAEEVGRQVSIFKNAHRAFVWLSQTTHNDLAGAITRIQNHSMQIREHIDKRPTALSVEYLIDSLNKDCTTLFADPWFSSLWTLQELVLRNDALVLCREAEPVEWAPGYCMFLTMLINHFRNVFEDVGAIGDPLKRSATIGWRFTSNESKIDACASNIKEQIIKAGFDRLFSRNPNVQYSTSKHRQTSTDVDRIYAIMQIYNIRVGKSLDPMRNPTLPELRDEFAIAINSACPILGQMFVHTDTPKEGKSWRITESSMVPDSINIYSRPKPMVQTEIRSGTMFTTGQFCSLIDLYSISYETIEYAIDITALSPGMLAAALSVQGVDGAQILRQYSGRLGKDPFMVSERHLMKVLLLGTVEGTMYDGQEGTGVVKYVGLVLCPREVTSGGVLQDNQFRRIGVCVWSSDGNHIWSHCQLEIH